MASGSEEPKALADALSLDKISRCANHDFDDIVIGHLKYVRVTRNGGTTSKDASSQQMKHFCDAVADQHEFLVRSLADILETALAVVSFRSAPATALGHAIATVEAYGEVPMDKQGPSQIVILQFSRTEGADKDMFTVA